MATKKVKLSKGEANAIMETRTYGAEAAYARAGVIPVAHDVDALELAKQMSRAYRYVTVAVVVDAGVCALRAEPKAGIEFLADTTQENFEDLAPRYPSAEELRGYAAGFCAGHASRDGEVGRLKVESSRLEYLGPPFPFYPRHGAGY